MVDFTKLQKASSGQSVDDPRVIFKRQPKPAGINDLWQSQREVLDGWILRRAERDVVIKLNTGGGKTLVGLLIAKAQMNYHGRGALYLCPDRQLVAQTVAKAEQLQLPVVEYVAGQGGPLPAAFLGGDAILVATYRALFHGYSKFGTRGRPRFSGDPFVQVSTIICDDAHTAFADLRSAFSISVSRAKNLELYHKLTAQFREGFEAVGRIGSYDFAVGGQDTGVFDVPHSTWRQQSTWVRDALLREPDNAEFKYTLPLLLDAFNLCHALVSTNAVTITSFLPLVDLLPTFVEATHRVFMSATIADDSALIRTFDVDPTAVRTPIAPESLAGVGERMILAPALTPVGAADELAVAKDVCVRAVEAGVGVVILTPSESRATVWKDIATVAVKDEVGAAVEALLDPARSDNGPYVFPNRYAGIDLPGNACRVLVLDGLPQGSNDYDLYRATVLRANSKIDLSLAQRVEQGMGRGTRGAGDYCVILLLGDLVDWIGRKDSTAMLTGATHAQLNVGLDISKAIDSVEEFYATVNQCLGRTAAWVKYHAQELADKSVAVASSAEAIDGAEIERAFLRQMQRGVVQQAALFADEAGHKHVADRHFRGWLLQLAAKAYDQLLQAEKSRALQAEAFDANTSLNRPPGRTALAPIKVPPQAESIAAIVGAYDRSAVLQQSIATALLPLSGKATASQFEFAVQELGRLLGFGSFRHDGGKGEGPDVAWVADGSKVFILSCKNEKLVTSPLYKKDLGTLLVDTEWVKNEYTGMQPISVVVQPNSTAEDDLPIEDIYVLTIVRLQEIVAKVTGLYAVLSESPLDQGGLHIRATELLVANHLTPPAIIKHFLQRFSRKQPAGKAKGGRPI